MHLADVSLQSEANSGNMFYEFPGKWTHDLGIAKVKCSNVSASGRIKKKTFANKEDKLDDNLFLLTIVSTAKQQNSSTY